MEVKKFIDIRQLIGSKNPGLLKWLPGFVIRYLKRILHEDEINVFMSSIPDAQDEEFCDEVMKLLNITLNVQGIENIPKDGKVVLAMNHPLAGMDAIALVSALRSTRTDLKFIVNDLLLNLKRMNGLFLGVNKLGKNTKNLRQQIDELFSSDYLVCIFPAGLVSRKQDGIVKDLEWKKTFFTMSKKNNRIIVPVHIDGQLSNFFYRLANFRSKLGIKANIEMLYLSNELFKLKNSTINVTIGQAIDPNDMPAAHDRKQAQIIKEKVYELYKNKK